MHCSIEKMIY